MTGMEIHPVALMVNIAAVSAVGLPPAKVEPAVGVDEML
jgi:hypothetical protein